MAEQTAIVVQHLSPGGIEVMAVEILRLLTDRMPAFVVSLEGTAATAIARWPALERHRHRLVFLEKPPGFRPLLIGRIARLFRCRGVTAVHTHHIGPLIYAGAAARLAGIRTRVHTEHDAWHLADRKRRLIARFALSAARPVAVADADLVAAALRRAIAGSDPRVIHNGVDVGKFSPRERHNARQALGLPVGGRIIGSAARLERVKGIDVLVEAMALLPQDVQLAVAGRGSESSALKARAGALGLDRRIHFLGLVDDMPAFYPALDLFCLPSREEGLPLSALEAQACGVRVVASDVGAVGEAICPASARLVPPGDPASLARAISESLAEAGAADPRAFVVKHRSAEAMVEAYLRLFRQAI